MPLAETELLQRCLDHLSELADIHESGGGNPRNIKRDINSIEGLLQANRPASPSAGQDTGSEDWCTDVATALLNLGGRARLPPLLPEVKTIRFRAGRSLPRHVSVPHPANVASALRALEFSIVAVEICSSGSEEIFGD